MTFHRGQRRSETPTSAESRVATGAADESKRETNAGRLALSELGRSECGEPLPSVQSRLPKERRESVAVSETYAVGMIAENADGIRLQ